MSTVNITTRERERTTQSNNNKRLDWKNRTRVRRRRVNLWQLTWASFCVFFSSNRPLQMPLMSGDVVCDGVVSCSYNWSVCERFRTKHFSRWSHNVHRTFKMAAAFLRVLKFAFLSFPCGVNKNISKMCHFSHTERDNVPTPIRHLIYVVVHLHRSTHTHTCVYLLSESINDSPEKWNTYQKNLSLATFGFMHNWMDKNSKQRLNSSVLTSFLAMHHIISSSRWSVDAKKATGRRRLRRGRRHFLYGCV